MNTEEQKKYYHFIVLVSNNLFSNKKILVKINMYVKIGK